ncbi:MAG: sodium:solute symporter [Bacteroidetes bacterium]|nr:sodium:solute symporter [Bacteroidota bacterium]
MFDKLNWADISIIAGYFLIIFGVAIWIFIQERAKKNKENQSEDYFLGGRSLGWLVIGASLFASNIGSEHLVGLAGSGASGNFVAGQFEILAALILLVLGWFFVPLYLRSGVYTMPEFLERRYDSWARKYLSWLSIVAYILTKITITIIAGGIVITALIGVPFWQGVLIIVILTMLYTLIGGLKVVIYTDFVQLIVLIGGAIFATWYGMQELGGIDVLKANTEPLYLNLWRSLEDPDFPWTGIIFGAPILGVWYWCTDQFIVQRVLAAKNLDQARKGTIFAGYLKLLPLFIFVLPGTIAYALSVGPDAMIEFPIINGKVNYDAALPILTMEVLPHGLKGLVVAGLLAALMSSLSSVFNSCSTLITIDIYKERFPEASEKRLVTVGRISTVVIVALGLACIEPIRSLGNGLFGILQSIQAYVAPPIAAVFLFGMFSKKLNAKGAKWSLLTGAILGGTRFLLEILKENGVEISGMFTPFLAINFLHFALYLFIICSIVLYAVSRSSEAPDYAKIENIMYKKGTVASLTTLQKGLMSGVIVLVIIIWLYFS